MWVSGTAPELRITIVSLGYVREQAGTIRIIVSVLVGSVPKPLRLRRVKLVSDYRPCVVWRETAILFVSDTSDAVSLINPASQVGIVSVVHSASDILYDRYSRRLVRV